jgi:glycine/D-amino acid oxidase-like deaminating enzyme
VTEEAPDVLVVGGGVAGLFCPYFLCQRGARVAVVERGQVGGPQSCSHGNTGFVGMQGATPLAEPGVMALGMRWRLSGRGADYRNLWADCGHSHIGLGLAPATGLLMAQLISGERPETDPGPLRVDRFDRSSRSGRDARRGRT